MLLLFAVTGVYAQSAATYGFTSTTGTYTENSGAATTIAGVRADTFLSTAQNIGFTFVYEGVNYTQFKMGSNGFISLNTTGTATLTTNDFSTANATSRPIIAPLWDDLDGATPTTSLASYEVTGVAPNRVLTVEWRNWEWNWNSGATPVISFQVKLYETTNVIEFIYRQEATAVALGSASIGIGSATGSGSGSYLNLTSVTVPAVSSTTSTTNINTKPATDQIFRFTPPTPCAGAPVAGSVSPSVQNICSGSTPANLVATGYSTGVSGVTFQWEESNDDGATDAWAPAVGGTGATTSIYTPPAFAGTTIYYRLNVTCTNSALSTQTASVSVNPPAAPSTQVTAVTIPSGTVNYSQAVVNWTNGNGLRRVVYISDSATFTDPVDGNAPALTPNTVYGGSGQQLIFDGTAATVTVTGLSGGTQYYIKAYEYIRCGAGPYDYYFNTSTGTNIGTFTTCTAFNVPYFEGFESGNTHNTTVAGCLNQASVTGTQVWTSNNTFTDYNRTPRTGGWNAFLRYSNEDWLFIPINLTAGTSYTVSLYARQDGATAANSNISISYGATPSAVGMTDAIVAATGIINGGYQQIAGSFTPVSTGVFFVGIKGYMNGTPWYISLDDISIDLTPACSAPLGLTVNNLDFDSADVTWTATTGNYEYVLDNVATDPVGAGTPLSGEIYNAGPLAPSTTYYFHVRTVCAGPTYSAWAMVSFTTPAAPPANDDCSNATALLAGGVFVDYPVVGTIVGATNSAAPAPGCASYVGGDVWYTITVPASGSITVETNNNGSTLTDTGMAVYSGTCAGLTLVECDDDDSADGNFSLIALTGRTPGEVLYVNVWEYGGGTADTFKISAYDASLSAGSFDLTTFKAFPNPVTNVLNLSYSTEISSVEVFNMLGQKVLVKELNVAQGQIDMSNLKAGNYLVKVTVAGQTKTIKVIKQ